MHLVPSKLETSLFKICNRSYKIFSILETEIYTYSNVLVRTEFDLFDQIIFFYLFSEMFFISLFSSFISSKKPVYNIEMVQTRNELPKTKNYIQIPGTSGNTLICGVSEKIRGPIYSEDPSELLSEFAGLCYDVQGSDKNKINFCFESAESKFNGKNLGRFVGYEFKDNKLTSSTVDGDLCIPADEDDPKSKDQFYSMNVNYECDNTISKKAPSIPGFWTSGNCTVSVLVKARQLCKHHSFSNEQVIDVKCIDKEKFDGIPFYAQE